MTSFFDPVRSALLHEAQQSPKLLSDLAGLEQYIAESYDSRSFAELLQNADDAGASRFLIQRVGDYLLVANDGRQFTQSDFESLCRSAASSKVRGSSIGFRGIGFKSVVGLANTIYLYSGDLAACFSREMTRREIPQATRVPLVRIPHAVPSDESRSFHQPVAKLLEQGFSTVFVFGDLVAHGIESEFESFDATSLLFLNNVRQLELCTNTEELFTARREKINEHTTQVRLATSLETRSWTLRRNHDVTLAFAHDKSGIIALREQDAVVHAFLPTHEPTGFPIKINSDLNTDPSRTRVVLDDETRRAIEQIADLILELLYDCLENPAADAIKMLGGLVPFSDPRTIAFQKKSFRKELLRVLKERVPSHLLSIRLRPNWLNAADFRHLASLSGIETLAPDVEGVNGILGLLRHLGLTEVTYAELSANLSSANLSLNGSAEFVSYLVNRFGTKQIALKEISPLAKIWSVDGSICSLDEAVRLEKPLDERFVDLVLEKSASRQEMSRLIERLTNSESASRLLPPKSSTSSDSDKQGTPSRKTEKGITDSQQKITLKRWRSAEQHVMEVLTAKGWQVSDVSRQNIGYDIEGYTASGQQNHIEVKSLDYVGQPFTLTNNEEAVAREKGENYLIALVWHDTVDIQIALIPDPAKNLKFIRQCRQWVWECSTYDFDPETFAVE